MFFAYSSPLPAGRVVAGRVDGDLAMSRSFGDRARCLVAVSWETTNMMPQ